MISSHLVFKLELIFATAGSDGTIWTKLSPSAWLPVVYAPEVVIIGTI